MKPSTMRQPRSPSLSLPELDSCLLLSSVDYLSDRAYHSFGTISTIRVRSRCQARARRCRSGASTCLAPKVSATRRGRWQRPLRGRILRTALLSRKSERRQSRGLTSTGFRQAGAAASSLPASGNGFGCGSCRLRLSTGFSVAGEASPRRRSPPRGRPRAAARTDPCRSSHARSGSPTGGAARPCARGGPERRLVRLFDHAPDSSSISRAISSE